MADKRKLLGVIVVIGVAIGIVSQLRWMAVRENARAAAATNAVVRAVATNAPPPAATNAVAKAAARVPPPPPDPQPPAPNLQPSTPNLQPSTPNPPPPKARKPIANDPNIPKVRQVLLANRRIAVATGRSFPKTFCATQTPTARGTAPYVVISELPVSRDVRIRAVANGAKVVGFLPNNALLVEADAQALKNLEEDVTFTAAVEYEPTDKLQRALLDGEKGEKVEATVVLLNAADLDGIRQFVTDNGGIVMPGSSQIGKSFSATIPRAIVEQLAGKAEVKWIEQRVRLVAFNDVAVKPGLMNVTPVREAPLGLTGAGQVISTTDTGVDTGSRTTMHPDIEHNLIGFQCANKWLSNSGYWGESTDRSGHGTHTAGSIVGDGTRSNGQFKGAAHGAKLWAWFCGQGTKGNLWPPLCQQGWYLWYDMERMFRPSDSYVAQIHSASWGGGDLAAYEDMCVSVDEFVWEHADFLPVFAAGNEGMSAKTVSVPGTAKNVLTVGACENGRTAKGWRADNPAQIASFSSCGPCADGRIKPDIVAPGTYVLSCLSTKASRCDWDDGSYTYYQYNCGTSMATPLTAGTAALVREWLAKYRGKSAPSAALVKAILTGGATDLKNESGNNVLKNVPDTRQGWGRVDLEASICPTNGLGVFLADWLPFRAGTNFTFRVTTTNAAPLNVQLVWTDYPGELEAAKALVNDLDLCVRAGGRTWFGNGGAAADDVNTVESVRIGEAAAGTYTVSVTCPSVPYDFDEGGAAAVYVRGAFDPADVEADPKAGTVILVR